MAVLWQAVTPCLRRLLQDEEDEEDTDEEEDEEEEEDMEEDEAELAAIAAQRAAEEAAARQQVRGGDPMSSARECSLLHIIALCENKRGPGLCMHTRIMCMLMPGLTGVAGLFGCSCA